MGKKGKLFYAEINKGNIIKVIIECIAITIPRTTFVINKEGLFHGANDATGSTYIGLNFPRENFDAFHCSKPLAFDLNTRHLQKITKNIKRKDSLEIFIEKTSPKKLNFCIKKSGSKTTIEVNYIGIMPQEYNEDLIEEIPDEDYDEETDSTRKIYEFPKNIQGSEFQKAKKLSSLSKKFTIEIQKDNYAAFSAQNANLFGSTIPFGEKDDEIEDYYKGEFNINIFSLLMKLPSICTQMKFYSPRYLDKYYPLKVKADAGNLGDITIIIKDNEAIEQNQDDE